MPEAVDVGSVLGGRYKVTAYVLASAERDLVLDGVDQVLNRPVSILVASDGNASQVVSSARDLATGDRNSFIQVLDLGITDGGTYLVTNRAPAADMLDLIVQQQPGPAEAPYVEPFFTDTLGSEIFGGPRSTEPETYDDDYDDDEYDDTPYEKKSRLSGLRGRFGRHGHTEEEAATDSTSSLSPVDEAPSRRSSTHTVPPPPSRRPGGSTAAGGAQSDGDLGPDRSDDGGPRESQESGGTRRRHDDSERRRSTGAGVAAAAGAGSVAGAVAASDASQPERAASRFPLSGQRDESQDSSDGSDRDGADGYDDGYDDGDDTADRGGRPFTRVLVGVVMTVILVVAVVVAATILGSISANNPVADEEATEQTSTEAATPSQEPTPAPATPTADDAPAEVQPVIAGLTRLVPGNPGLDAGNDSSLPLIIDGNPSTFWGNQVYASDTFGGLATNFAFVVQLEAESTISEVSIAQLNGSGGAFSVLVNDQPALEGAEQVAQGGFTAPTVSLPIPDSTEGARTGQYVIVNFTQLPRLSGIQAQYPFGLRIAEISVN